MNIEILNKVGDWSDPWTKRLRKQVQNFNGNNILGGRLLLENEKLKVWSSLLEPGQSLPFHKHNKPYFYTIYGSGKSRSFYFNGQVKETQYENNDIQYFHDLNENNYFIHNLENIGETNLVFTIVEFKTRQ